MVLICPRYGLGVAGLVPSIPAGPRRGAAVPSGGIFDLDRVRDAPVPRYRRECLESGGGQFTTAGQSGEYLPGQRLGIGHFLSALRLSPLLTGVVGVAVIAAVLGTGVGRYPSLSFRDCACLSGAVCLVGAR
jgi:hypothetical protein